MTKHAREMARDDLGHGCFAIDLDGHVQSFHESIRDALIGRGVLHCDALGIWRLRWHGFDLEREHARWMGCCDFCSGRPVCWTFPCSDFDIPGPPPPMTSQGEWDACATCGTFINEGRWDMLLNHCDDMKRNAESVLPRSVQRALHELRADIHRRFKAHRCGDGVPQPPSPFGH